MDPRFQIFPDKSGAAFQHSLGWLVVAMYSYYILI